MTKPPNTGGTATALKALYDDRSFKPKVWTDSSDHAYIGIVLIERSIAKLAAQLSGQMLDVGCGQQPYRNYFTHVTRLRTSDFDSKRGSVDFECPADRIPLQNESLDSILCTEVLEHVPNPASVWREFNRLLKPGGRVLLTTPMYWPSHEEPFDYFRHTEFGLCHMAENAGFQVIYLLPRGGIWAFFGQVIMHAIPQYIPFRWMRRLLNKCFLHLDAWRQNPRITIGWTLLAEKNVS